MLRGRNLLKIIDNSNLVKNVNELTMKKTPLALLFLLSFIGFNTSMLAQHVHEVPDTVKQHFVEKHAAATDIQWQVDEVSNATVHFDVFVVEYTENDIDITKFFDLKEKLLETRTKIKRSNLESEVNDSLEVHYPGLRIFTIEKIEKSEEKPFYQMMIKHKEANYFLKVNLKGIILIARKD